MVEQSEPEAAGTRPVEPEPWCAWERNEGLEELCRERWRSDDAMAWHMPTLRRLAMDCNYCVEFGLRRANSTVALLAGCVGGVATWDIDVGYAPDLYRRIEKATDGRWYLTEGSSAEATIPWCDLLLHDSEHSYDNVKAELDAHGRKVRKYIVFHDSVACGEVGTKIKVMESGKQKKVKLSDGSRVRGIMPAIEEFMEANPEWKIKLHDRESCGLLVLERSVGDGARPA